MQTRTWEPKIRITKILVAALLLVAFAACGDDDGEATATSAPTDQTTSADDMGSDDGTTAESGGVVTIGAETWAFVPDIQCSVWPDDTINIAGSAAEDAAIEIVFDRFDDGSTDLRVSGPDFEWTADAFGEITVDGDRVSGTASVTQVLGGETAEAAFDFQC